MSQQQPAAQPPRVAHAGIPDFRPRLKEITMPILVRAGRYDRALYPRLQYQFTEHAS
jgi:pimeloyl-ACP methyl ester carboxylesterase